MAVFKGIISYPKGTQITSARRTADAWWMPMESVWDHDGARSGHPACTTNFPVANRVPRSTNAHHSSRPRQTKSTEPCLVQEHSTTEWSSADCDDETPRLRERFPTNAVAYIRLPYTFRRSRRSPSRGSLTRQSHPRYFGFWKATAETPEHFHEPDWTNRSSSR